MTKYYEAWHVSDRTWYAENPNRSYRIRKAIPGEPAVGGRNCIPAMTIVIVRRLGAELYHGISFVALAPIPDQEDVLRRLFQKTTRVQYA